MIVNPLHHQCTCHREVLNGKFPSPRSDVRSERLKHTGTELKIMDKQLKVKYPNRRPGQQIPHLLRRSGFRRSTLYFLVGDTGMTSMTLLADFEQILFTSVDGWRALVQQGGAVSVVLIAIAIVGLAIIIEKSFSLRRPVNFNDDYGDVLLALKRDNDDQIEYELNLYPPTQTDLVRAAHEARELEKDDILRELSSVANTHLRTLSRRLDLLASLGRLAPLLGLLGTVIGIMRSLTDAGVRGALSPGVMSQGLTEALLTTAAGLIVGIPLIFFHNLFKSRINNYSEEFEEFGYDLVRSIVYPASVEFGDRDGEEIDSGPDPAEANNSPGDSGAETNPDRSNNRRSDER